jgi:two-component system chemotaxis response regulator CheB
MTTVLVVDDSALMRKYLKRMLEDGGFDVVTARNGEDALEQVHAVAPDVVTLDVNMPEMDGLTCLSRIMAESPRPVVMVSSLTDKGALATLEALELGAVDYLAKPGGTVSLGIDLIADELVAKVRTASRAQIRRSGGLAERLRRQRQAGTEVHRRPSPQVRPARRARPRIVVVGSSTGGPGVLAQVLSPLPSTFPVPIVIAQHIPALFTRHLAERLDETCSLHVVEVDSAVRLVPGTVFIGQGDADVVLAKRPDGPMARRVPASAEHRWHPSVDRLVTSATAVFDPASIVCVQLTGMGDDGAEAMASVHNQGGLTIAESEESAVVWGMPGELVRRGGADAVLAAEDIAAQLVAWN